MQIICARSIHSPQLFNPLCHMWKGMEITHPHPQSRTGSSPVNSNRIIQGHAYGGMAPCKSSSRYLPQNDSMQKAARATCAIDMSRFALSFSNSSREFPLLLSGTRRTTSRHEADVSGICHVLPLYIVYITVMIVSRSMTMGWKYGLYGIDGNGRFPIFLLPNLSAFVW
jgi:hypothetical protein